MLQVCAMIARVRSLLRNKAWVSLQDLTEKYVVDLFSSHIYMQERMQGPSLACYNSSLLSAGVSAAESERVQLSRVYGPFLESRTTQLLICMVESSTTSIFAIRCKVLPTGSVSSSVDRPTVAIDRLSLPIRRTGEDKGIASSISTR